MRSNGFEAILSAIDIFRKKKTTVKCHFRNIQLMQYFNYFLIHLLASTANAEDFYGTNIGGVYGHPSLVYHSLSPTDLLDPSRFDEYCRLSTPTLTEADWYISVNSFTTRVHCLWDRDPTRVNNYSGVKTFTTNLQRCNPPTPYYVSGFTNPYEGTIHPLVGTPPYGVCSGTPPPPCIDTNGNCEEPKKCKIPGDGEKNLTGNPCDVATGAKYHTESLNLQSGLDFPLSYSTGFGGDAGIGVGWNSMRFNKLSIAENKIGISRGRHLELWHNINGVWQGDVDSIYILQATTSGYELHLKLGGVETYSALGLFLTETSPAGQITSYSYDSNNNLTEVTDHYGKKLQFEYDANNHIEAVINSAGTRYTFAYDANNNLISVKYPDTTPGDDMDNPIRHYHYENVDYPHHLTGITDENGDRFATYTYDASGKAISTEHAQTTGTVGQEKFELNFQGQ